MKIKDIVEVSDAKVLCGTEQMEKVINHGFASDLMSDVLTLEAEHLVLITGLTNMQTIRTAEVAEIQCILFVRNKKVTDEMLSLAQENGIVILQCRYSMFHAIGRLFSAGLEPVY